MPQTHKKPEVVGVCKGSSVRRCGWSENVRCVFLNRTWLQEERSREGSPSYQRQKNKEAEEELHHISEKLSHRLEELDQVCSSKSPFVLTLEQCPGLIRMIFFFFKMLKRVLGESGEGVEGREEDQGSRHRAPRPHTGTHSLSLHRCCLGKCVLGSS